MTREQAINYLISSGFSDEQVSEVVRALTYETTTKNDLGVERHKQNIQAYAHDFDVSEEQAEKELAVKNDCISRADLYNRIKSIEYVEDYECDEYGGNRITYRTCDWDEVLREIIYAPSVTQQEPQTFKWCTDCREYDQEKHCCHRWSKVIRNTVEEMKQEYIEREVLDKIREEIDLKYGHCVICEYSSDYYGSSYESIGDITDVLQIISKHKAESEADNGDNT